MSAALQLRRILHLIPTLADDRPHPINAVAEQAGVDRPTLLQDLKSLAERFDDPGGFVEGVRIFLESDQVAVHSDHFLRPMRLTLPELCALELGLAMLRAERPPDETRAIDGARERLRQVIAKLPGQDIQEKDFAASLGGAVDLEMLSLLRRAVRERRRVRFAYHKSGAGEATARLAAPLAVVYAELSWYLVALADGATGLRFFRLDRMDEVEVTEEAFEAPAEFSMDAVLRERKMFLAEGAGTLRVRYSARVARWVAEREGVSVDADGTVTLEHPLADPHWALRHVLQYGPDAEVLTPAEIRKAIAEGLQEILGE
mgnify:CR=1 FL=1